MSGRNGAVAASVQVMRPSNRPLKPMKTFAPMLEDPEVTAARLKRVMKSSSAVENMVSDLIGKKLQQEFGVRLVHEGRVTHSGQRTVD
eukprot:g33113.t2